MPKRKPSRADQLLAEAKRPQTGVYPLDFDLARMK